MTIYALKSPSLKDYKQEILEKIQDFLVDSIKNGVSRFGWSYISTADLTKLQDKSHQKMNTDEKKCWIKSKFLLKIKKGDWVVHVNLPRWGACLAGEVSEPYSFDQNDNNFTDYCHLLKLDKNSIVEFKRNDDEVLPIISSRLKLRGRFWRIKYVDEFFQTIQNVNDKSKKTKFINI
jgi:hypothetical protein